MTTGATERDRQKADRRAWILREAARLFAERGFSGVSLEEIGAAVEISGPAVYRHFAGKQALLGAILVNVSERLLAGGTDVIRSRGTAHDQLSALVHFHVDFALTQADVIRVQDRDLASLSDDDRRTVRRLQRAYVELWIGVLAQVVTGAARDELRLRAHACFGLINSTPHSVSSGADALPEPDVRRILEVMAVAALTS